jgi:hypothetical protein
MPTGKQANDTTTWTLGLARLPDGGQLRHNLSTNLKITQANGLAMTERN